MNSCKPFHRKPGVRRHALPPRPRPARGLCIACWLLVMILPVARAEVTLNLKDAEIGTLIATVSAITGRNFVVDPRVKGKVTVISNNPMSDDAVYEVFQSVLRVHGFAAVPAGAVTKIVPEANAKQDAVPFTPGSGDGVDALVTQVVTLNHVAAAQLVPILRPLVPPQGHLAAYAPSNTLIISDRAGNIGRLMEIVKRVDLDSGDEVEVLTLQHASATEMVRVLTSLDQQRTGQEGRTPLRVVADERTNTIIMSGDRSGRLRYRAIVAHLDTPMASSGFTQVIYLNYAEAANLVPIIQGVAQSYAETPAQQGQPAAGTRIDIQADETTNALVLTAPPDLQRTIAGIIRELDVRRAQVAVEAIIAEISFSKAAELGVNWIIDASGKTPGAVGFINLNQRRTSALAGLITDSTTDAAQDAAQALGGLSIGVGDLDGNIRFAAVLSALLGDTDTNILSMPTVVTLDNEEAEITVGENVPFITGSFTSTGSGDGVTNPFQTIERQDIGVKLKVKPQINEGNAVRLEIVQEVSAVKDATPSSQGTADIVTLQRKVATKVMVDSGNVVVLGGLIDDSVRQTINKVPLLGDVPLLGSLFRYRETTKEKRNLMVFLRPVIIRDELQNRYVTHRKYLYMQDLQRIQREKGISLLPEEQASVLPSMEALEQGGIVVGQEQQAIEQIRNPPQQRYKPLEDPAGRPPPQPEPVTLPPEPQTRARPPGAATDTTGWENLRWDSQHER